MIYIFAFGIVFTVLGAMFFYEYINAPDGWEDEDGFHYDEK